MSWGDWTQYKKSSKNEHTVTARRCCVWRQIISLVSFLLQVYLAAMAVTEATIEHDAWRHQPLSIVAQIARRGHQSHISAARMQGKKGHKTSIQDIYTVCEMTGWECLLLIESQHSLPAARQGLLLAKSFLWLAKRSRKFIASIESPH